MGGRAEKGGGDEAAAAHREGAGEVKTAQPFAEDSADERYSQMGGGAPKPRPDQVDDEASQGESDKTTQRQE